MTQTTERRPLPRPAPARPARHRRSPVGPGSRAGLWAAGAGLVSVALPVLLVWASDPRSGSAAGGALRTAGLVWLVAHGAALRLPGGDVGLTPLGLVALPLLLLARAGSHSASVTRAGRGLRLQDAARLVGVLSASYAGVVLVVAVLVSHGGVRPSLLQSVLGALVVAAVGSATGVVREAGLWPVLRARVPEWARAAALGATGGLGILLGAGAILGALSLGAHGQRATDLAGASHPGVIGGLALLLTGVLLLPNAAVWALSWLAGPGFALGVGTAVGPFGTRLGATPAVPVLAALPGGGLPTWLGILVLALPMGAGAVAGLLVARRSASPSALHAAGRAALVGPAAGLAAAVLAWLSGGPLGEGRLAQVGPSPWRLGLTLAVELAVPAAAVAAVRHARG